MFKSILRSLFGPPLPPHEPFQDALLGELLPGEIGWTVELNKADDSYSFSIGGDSHPSAPLLDHAREIFNNYESFKRIVKECLEAETRDYPADVKEEVSRLEIDDISLFWPDRPNDGMIFFRGPHDYIRAWRCDYIDRRPVGLGCDT